MCCVIYICCSFVVKVVLQTKEALTKHAEKIAKQADKHEQLINKVTYCLGVLGFGTFCFLLGSRPQDIPYLYCLFFIIVAPLRWIYYRIKKWHYFLLDFCYYANAIFMTMLLFFPNNEKLFMVCFSFSEGPLAWALIVWRCSLVFSSIDKIVSVLIHLLPGTVFFIIRWWDPSTFPRHSTDDTGPWPAWPLVDSSSSLWTWLFFVPLVAYCVWQAIYFLIVEGLRRQRLLNDPQVMTSYRELKRKAERANNIWWRLSGLLGDERRVIMYAALQAAFTVATLALTVPLFKSYRLHIIFEIFKLLATVWYGGNFVFEVMPRQVVAKKEKAKENADPAVDVNGMKGKQNLGRSKSSGMIATTNVGNATSMEDLSCSANYVVGSVMVKNQDICALCRRSSAENLADFLQLSGDLAPMENDRQGSESAAFQSFWPAHDVDRIKFLRRGLSGCNKSPDSQRGKMERNGQVACIG